MDKDKDTVDEFYISSLDSNQISTINIEDIIKDLNLPPLDMYSSGIDNPSLQGSSGCQTVTINTSSNPSQWSTSYYANPPTTSAPSQWQFTSLPSIKPFQVEGVAEFNGDIKWKGRSLGQMLETIERRLNILVPDPEKLEHYEALKKAYEHYRTLEALCDRPSKEEEQ